MGTVTGLHTRKMMAAGIAACLTVAAGWVVLEQQESVAGGGSSRTGALLASAPVLPNNGIADVAVLATSRKAIRQTWRRFNLPGGPPGSVTRRDALFLGTGESGSCPKEFIGMDRIEGKKLVKVGVKVRWASRGCTEDFRPRTFVVAARHRFFPKGRFEVKIGENRRVSAERKP